MRLKEWRIPFQAKYPSNRLLVYWLPKSECRIIPSVFLTFVQIHNGGQICPPFFRHVNVGDVHTPLLIDGIRCKITFEDIFLSLPASWRGDMSYDRHRWRITPSICNILSVSPIQTEIYCSNTKYESYSVPS